MSRSDHVLTRLTDHVLTCVVGQARLDGAFCDYTEEDKINFLKKAHSEGVCNIEMESLCFAAMCCHANIKGDLACQLR